MSVGQITHMEWMHGNLNSVLQVSKHVHKDTKIDWKKTLTHWT